MMVLRTAAFSGLWNKHRKGSIAVLADGLDHDGAEGQVECRQLDAVLRLPLQGSVQQQLTGARVHIDDHFTGIGCIDIEVSPDGGVRVDADG